MLKMIKEDNLDVIKLIHMDPQNKTALVASPQHKSKPKSVAFTRSLPHVRLTYPNHNL